MPSVGVRRWMRWHCGPGKPLQQILLWWFRTDRNREGGVGGNGYHGLTSQARTQAKRGRGSDIDAHAKPTDQRADLSRMPGQ